MSYFACTWHRAQQVAGAQCETVSRTDGGLEDGLAGLTPQAHSRSRDGNKVSSLRSAVKCLTSSSPCRPTAPQSPPRPVTACLSRPLASPKGVNPSPGLAARICPHLESLLCKERCQKERVGVGEQSGMIKRPSRN